MRPWVERISVTLIGALLLPFVWQVAVLQGFALGMMVFGAIATSIYALGRWRKRDPYDLGALREVQERETVRALLDEETPPDSNTVVCRNCGACYSAHIGVCPECGLIAGQ
jgi:rubrerythrin